MSPATGDDVAGDASPPPRRFSPVGDEIVVELPDVERELLRHVLPQLRELVMADDDPITRRLKPPARPDDPDAEQTYRELVDDDLLLARLEAIETVEEGIDGARLDQGGVAAWMQSLNALRLVLGERLADQGIDLARLGEVDTAPDDTAPDDTAPDDTAPDDTAEADDRSAALELFEWLGWILGDLVDAAEGMQPDR